MFIEKLLESELSSSVADIRREFTKQASTSEHGQIERALKRFSLVAAAGELATQFGITSWKKGEALESTLKLFSEWRNTWSSSGSRETQKLILQIKSLLQEFGPARFPVLSEFKKLGDEHRQQLWGFRKESEEGYDWVVLNEVFRNQFCKGLDYKRSVRDLKTSGYLKDCAKPMRVPHLGVTRVLTISGAIIQA